MEKEIHIGQLIKRKMEEEGRKVSWLANKINCDESNIYRIYQRKSIPIEQFFKICIQLEIDLFPDCSEYVRQEIQKKRSKM